VKSTRINSGLLIIIIILYCPLTIKTIVIITTTTTRTKIIIKEERTCATYHVCVCVCGGQRSSRPSAIDDNVQRCKVVGIVSAVPPYHPSRPNTSPLPLQHPHPAHHPNPYRIGRQPVGHLRFFSARREFRLVLFRRRLRLSSHPANNYN